MEVPEFENVEFAPYDVTCARCGKIISCEDANLEEGDEWECWPCAERCDAQERAERNSGVKANGERASGSLAINYLSPSASGDSANNSHNFQSTGDCGEGK